MLAFRFTGIKTVFILQYKLILSFLLLLKNLLAVGFQDGSVTLFRGDITRQKSGKMKTLPETGSSPITGLAFK